MRSVCLKHLEEQIDVGAKGPHILQILHYSVHRGDCPVQLPRQAEHQVTLHSISAADQYMWKMQSVVFLDEAPLH